MTERSPFHEGERQVQERLGVRNRIETFARKVVRDFLPKQHREFYAGLPFLLIGSVDGLGRPWASLIAGKPGFVTSPDDRTLRINAPPIDGDPLKRNLRSGLQVGILGIDPAARRQASFRAPARRPDIRVSGLFRQQPLRHHRQHRDEPEGRIPVSRLQER